MTLKYFVIVCVLCAVASSQTEAEWKPVSPASPPINNERTGKFINFKKLYSSPSVETNEIEQVAKEENSETETDPDEALTSIYSECVLQFSFPCLQKKFLVFLDRLGRMDGFQIFGEYLSVHKVRNETIRPITEKDIEARMSYKSSWGDLDSLVQYSIDRFFNNHVLRVRLPFGLAAHGGDMSTGRSLPSTDVIDIGFEKGMSEGRGKKKKLLMMFLMMLKMKFAMMIPIAIAILKFKVIKALILAKIALILAKLSLLKKLLEKKKEHDEKHKIVIIHDPHHSSGHHDSYSGSSGGGDSYSSSHGSEGWSSGGSGHGSWGRSIPLYDGQSLAYRGQDPSKNS